MPKRATDRLTAPGWGALAAAAVALCACSTASPEMIAAPADGNGDRILPKPVREIERTATMNLTTPLGEGFSVTTTTYQAGRYRGVVPQQYDFSCGAAALATLLTHHYGIDIGEAEIFKAMYETGNRVQIRQQGFSLLDLKEYLSGQGIQSSGFNVTVEELREEGVPAIQLINMRGYLHFVVIKGMNETEVLVGDPATGLTRYSIEQFKEMREGDVAFVLTDYPVVGRRSFHRESEFRTAERPVLDAAFEGDGLISLDQFNLRAPDEYVFQGID